MDLRSGHPFWLLKNGLGKTYPPLEEDLKAEVAIIGGGITGALIAYHLAEAGIDAALLDKRDIGWGSTAASTALLQYEIDKPLHELREMYGREFADRAYLSCADAIRKIEALVVKLDSGCGFQRKASIYLAENESGLPKLRDEFLAREEAGFEVGWLDEGELGRIGGISRPAGIRSACGAQVDAFLLAHEALAAACEMGTRAYDRTSVENCDFFDSGAKISTDRGFTVTCRQVIFATGYEVKDFLRRDVVNLNSSFAMVTEPLPGPWPAWEGDALIWEMANPYLYVRSTEDRRIIVGGEDERFRNPVARDALVGAKSGILLRKLRELLPHIEPEIAFAWAGTFGETEDGLAYIGRVPEQPCAHYALGFGGNGITYSILAAEIIRDSLLGKRHEYADLFRFERQQKQPCKR
jgi:glycine/D-amino acid oxidase-like deaminating enzyme